MMMIIELPPAHEQTMPDRSSSPKKTPQESENKSDINLGCFVTALRNNRLPPRLAGF
jgi:hypothetical protein